MFTVDALGPAGPYRARKQLTVTDVTGAPVASVSLVPRLFVTRTMSALHKASPLPTPVVRLELRSAGTRPSAVEVPGDEFVIGYGLDVAERYRNLESVHTYAGPAVP